MGGSHNTHFFDDVADFINNEGGLKSKKYVDFDVDVVTYYTN